MSARRVPITFENSRPDKSLAERIKILQHVSPAKADAISTFVNYALKDEWQNIGQAAPYRWNCDAPSVVKKSGDR